MRLRRIICFSLAAIMILSLVGCDSSKKTAANETESKYIIDENPLAFVSDNEVKFVKQKDGFGASFTDTTTYLLMGLPEETRNDAMTKLFDDEKGIGLSLIRNPIAACDFSLEYYTYDDMPEGEEDFELEHFDFSKAADQVALT